MLYGPKGYTALICEVRLSTCSMETVQQNGCYTLFLVNSTLKYILFSLVIYHRNMVKNIKYNDQIAKIFLGT